MFERLRFKILTLSTTFYDILVSRNPVSKSKNSKICDILANAFFNCERTCDLTDVTASSYDRKTDARPFDTIHNILQCVNLVQSILRDRNVPIWRIRNRRVKSYLSTNIIQLKSGIFSASTDFIIIEELAKP